jgi:hypothetical protein
MRTSTCPECAARPTVGLLSAIQVADAVVDLRFAYSGGVQDACFDHRLRSKRWRR